MLEAKAPPRPPAEAPPRQQPAATPPIVGENVLTQRPPYHVEVEPQPASYFAVYEGGFGETRVTRSGRWIRSDYNIRGHRSSEISDMSTGTSFMLMYDAEGAVAGMQVIRSGAEQSYYSVERTDTGATDTVLGESCRVIAWRRGVGRASEARTLRCVTADGIELWSGTEGGGGNDEYSRRRVTSFERRRVNVRDVAPPRELFRWATWAARAGPAGAVNQSGDYQIELASPGGDVTTQVVRRRGDWMYNDTRRWPSQRTFTLANGGVRLSYGEGAPFEEQTLNIFVTPVSTPSPQAEASRTPAPNRPPEVIADEHCSWFVTFTTSHSSTLECKTEDGLTLHYIYAGDGARGGRRWEVRAMRLDRMPIPERAMTPPPEVFDWLSAYAR